MKISPYIILVYFILLIAQTNGQTTVAIADFENRSGEFYLDSWEKSVPDLLKSELSGEPSIILVERRKLEAVLKEQALSMTGLVDSSTAQKVGDLLGAEYVVSGSIDKNAELIMINATITKVSNGETKVEVVSASNQDYLNQMISLLGDNIIHTLLGIGDYREKIKIKKYPTTYFLAGTAILGIGTILANQQYLEKRDEYNQNTSLTDFDAKYDEANKWHKTRNVLTVLTGVAFAGTIYCWIKNLNPDVIAAREQNSELSIIPGLQFDKKGNWRAYVAVRF